MKACPKCGCTTFHANQYVQGYVSVLATVDKDSAVFLSNPTEDGEMDTSGLDCGNPEGPFHCEKCEWEGDIKDMVEGKDEPSLVDVCSQVLGSVGAVLEDADDTGCDGMVTLNNSVYNKLRQAYHAATGKWIGVEVEDE